MTGSPGPAGGGPPAGPPGADPRDAAPQRVLPLVVRVERAEPPNRTDALEAAAVAVLTLLADSRSQPAGATPAAGDLDPAAGGVAGPAPAGDEPGGGRPGEWADAVREWADARIRKVVRRARGAEWRRAGALDGITVVRRTAEVRVFPPVPLDGWPRDLARLQVSGTDLADPVEPSPPAMDVPVLWLNPHLELTAGKAMAQVGHAAQLGWDALARAERDRWRVAGFELAVRTASRTGWDRLLRAGLPLVRDAGFTEIAPGSCTAVADHPALHR